MLAQSLGAPIESGDECYALGSFVILRQHEPRQLWLPFITGVVVTKPMSVQEALDSAPSRPQTKKKPRTVNQKKIQLGSRRREDAKFLHMYQHELGVDQLPLPFHEFRRIHNKEYARISAANYPAFERMQDGRLALITFNKQQDSMVRQWCAANSVGRYHIKLGTATFMKINDAVLAKLALE